MEKESFRARQSEQAKEMDRSIPNIDPNIENRKREAVLKFAIETGLMRPWLVRLIHHERVTNIERSVQYGLS